MWGSLGTAICSGLCAAAIALSGCAPVCPRAPGLSAAECAQLEAMRLPAQLPASPGNLVADDDRAAQLGFELFFDARLSRNSDVRCASCHAPSACSTTGARARSGSSRSPATARRCSPRPGSTG
ncbi:MAG: cytochrome c peroxidase [Myxococcota bacterium]